MLWTFWSLSTQTRLRQAYRPTPPETMAFEAGSIMLPRLHTLVAAKVSFTFESTLSSRTFALFSAHCKAQGYQVHIYYAALTQRRAGHLAPGTARQSWRTQHPTERCYTPLSAPPAQHICPIFTLGKPPARSEVHKWSASIQTGFSLATGVKNRCQK